MGPRGRFYPYLCILHILDCLRQDMQVLYLGRAPRTKETLPDFLKWRRVTRPPLVFRGLTGSQRTPGFWGITLCVDMDDILVLCMIGCCMTTYLLLDCMLLVYMGHTFIPLSPTP